MPSLADVQLHHQFALAQYLHNNISEEDQERLLFHPDTGRWAGYKHPYGFKRAKGPEDGIVQFNWYKEEWENYDRLPKCILPFMDEIQAFSEVSIGGTPLHTELTSSTFRTRSIAASLLCFHSSSNYRPTTFGTTFSPTAGRQVKDISVTLYSDLWRRRHSRRPRVFGCTVIPTLGSSRFFSRFQSPVFRSGATTMSGTTPLTSLERSLSTSERRWRSFREVTSRLLVIESSDPLQISCKRKGFPSCNFKAV